MGTDEGPGGGGRGGYDLAARALLVVALGAVTAAALSARRDLDWDRLGDAPQDNAARLVLGAGGGVLLFFVARWFLRLMREAAAAPDDDGDEEDEGRRIPWGLVLLATVLAVLASALVGAGLAPLLQGRSVRTDPAQDGSGGGDGGGLPGSSSWAVLVVVAGALLAAVLLRRFARREPPVAVDAPPGTDDEAPTDASLLADAVGAAQQTLAGHDDTRGAIIAAYGAMERSLARGLAPRGEQLRVSDTPTELLERVVEAGLVSRGAAQELTDLFREARFSRHQLLPAARTAAESALARVSTELRVRRG